MVDFSGGSTVKLRYLILIASVIAVSGCGREGAEPPRATSPPASTVPANLVPPEQKIYPGEKRVPIDPCTELDESVYRAIGFDPATRTRHDEFTEVAVLGCSVEGAERWGTVMATNADFESQWRAAQHRAERTAVNGRDAYIGPNAINPDGCTLVMRTEFGMLILNTDNAIPRHRVPLPPACDGVPEMGAVIEASFLRGF